MKKSVNSIASPEFDAYWSPSIKHHGALHGVTGSCHELFFAEDETDRKSVLIDCGLFQGDDHSSHGETSANAAQLMIDFDLSSVRALCVTHAHIDHIGRIPYLLMAGFDQPIFCSEASALMIPLMLEDAIKLGLTRDRRLIEGLLNRLKQLLHPVPYHRWFRIDTGIKLKFKPAGHILGSAYIEFDVVKPVAFQKVRMPGRSRATKCHRVIFSGDLGAPYAALLSAPKSPYSCDTLILESTYGNRCHEGRKARQLHLKEIVERCLENRGVLLIPAFSLGRTQTLLYEFEQIIQQYAGNWSDIEIVVDSPMAQKLTAIYRRLTDLWDREAKKKLASGRHPLNFTQMTVIDDARTHDEVVRYLQKTARPTIVIAASGMCTGGRIVHYLKALIGDYRTDILFSGYQARGSTGAQILQYGDKSKYPFGWVELDGRRYDIQAGVHSISGFSAHADQKNLLSFVGRMKSKPLDIRLVHGDERAKEVLKQKLHALYPESRISVP